MSRPELSGWRAILALLSLPYGLMLLLTSENRWTDLVVLALLVGLALVVGPWLARGVSALLPFPEAPDPEPPLTKRAWGVIAAVSLGALILWWPALTHDVERSGRWLIVASAHGDEGRYKPVLEDMFRRGTLDPHPKQIFFNYGHLHINLVMIPLLPLRGLFSDPATVALLGARLLSFLAFLAALVVGGVWCWRRWGLAAAAAFALLLGTHPTVVARAQIAQTPDTLVLLTMLLAALHAARFASQPNRRDIVLATVWAGVAAGVKYIGLFFVPILVPLLLIVWRACADAWPRPTAALKAVAGFGLLFLIAFLACSPYHVFHPRAVAVMFLKASHEYFPGAFTPGISLRWLLSYSLLDVAIGVGAVVAVPVVLRSGWRSLRESLSVPAESSWSRGDLVLLAWAGLWTGYVSLFMHNPANTLPHLMFPAFPLLVLPLARVTQAPTALPAHVRPAWSGVFLGLWVVLAVLPATLPRPDGGGSFRFLGRQAKLGGLLDRPDHPPQVDREPLEWLAGHGVPYDARMMIDSEAFVPRVWPHVMHGTGPLLERRVGLFAGFPELLLTERAYQEPWLKDTSDFPDAVAIRRFYAALDAGTARPYRRIARLARFDLHAVPWLGGRELLDARAAVAAPFEAVPRRVRNPLWIGIERAARAYRGPEGAAFPQTLELKLPRAGRPTWLLLLWDTRENMAGWYRDEAYATALRLEAWVDGAWQVVHDVPEHRPDAYGGLVAPLSNAPESDRWRLVIGGWHGPGPVRIEHLALPEPPR